MTPYTFDVRDFVPKEIYLHHGENSKWFVSDSIVKLHKFFHEFFDDYVRKTDTKQEIDSIKAVVNDWAGGGQFNNRGLRTVEYINSQVAAAKAANKPLPAMISQHIGGATNAMDVNILIKMKDGTKHYMDSNLVRKIISENEKAFMDAGLTTLEDGAIATGWCHADCRHTGLPHIFIVRP